MTNQDGPVRRHVDELVRGLLAPLLGSRGGFAGWELVGWDAEQGICLTLRRGETYLLVELERRNDDFDCYARTDRFNVCARRQFSADRTMSEPERVVVDRLVDMLREREGSLPWPERPGSARNRAVREILVDRVLIPEGRNHYYINPYAGCMIGCPFCYVRDRADFSRALEGLPSLPWGRYVDVKVNAADVLRREVRAHPPGIVRLSPILTDPYQGLERRYRITRQCLEVLLEAGYAVAVLTRAARLVDDLDLLLRFPRAVAGFSIPTDQDRIRAIFEPGGDPVDERLEALRTCHEAGLVTLGFVQPMLPMDVPALVDRMAPFVRAVRIDRMYFGHHVRQLYREHGLEHACTDAFFQQTGEELRTAFARRGVRVDEMDDLEPLFGL